MANYDLISLKPAILMMDDSRSSGHEAQTDCLLDFADIRRLAEPIHSICLDNVGLF